MKDSQQELNQFGQTIMARIEEALPKAVREAIFFLGELTIIVDRAVVSKVCSLLRDHPDLRFNYMCDLSAVDKWPEHPRFEVNVHLLALPQAPQPQKTVRRIRLKVCLPEHDARMTTLTGVWPSAAWYERETHELFGIHFEGHPDMRPLLLPDDWQSTPPLRRDVPVHVEEVAFSFNREQIHGGKDFARE